VLVLAELDRHQAVAVLERIREKLAEAHTGDHPPFTAGSFAGGRRAFRRRGLRRSRRG
jgi:hypothetical protein